MSREVLDANLDRMRRAPREGTGFDVVVVSTGDRRQQAFWRERLEQTRGQVLSPDAALAVVVEDWPGGAGNGLGTLYALHRAAATIPDLHERLDGGAAVAVYHTAGKGTRLAPLPGSEGNNKPAVRLPGLVEVGGRPAPITLLEAVLLQTGLFAGAGRGRIGVFWGDQVFIPSVPPPAVPDHHVALLARRQPFPSPEDYAARELHRYGLLALDADGDAVQIEKASRREVVDLVERGVLSTDGGIAVSLGSFSMSARLAEELLAEFAPALQTRQGKLDADPHFWMPLTHDEATYADLMARRGEDPDRARAHHARMAALRDRLDADRGVLGALDVGTGGYWWDYGQLASYVRNNLRLTGTDHEAATMRAFFGVEAGSDSTDADVDDRSILLDAALGGGRVRRSVLIGVRAGHVEADGALLVEVTAPAATADQGLLYRVHDAEPVEVGTGQARVDVDATDGRHLVFRAPLDGDGKADWERVLPGNPMSWAELHRLQAGGD